MIGRAAKVFDVAVVEPFGQVTGDVAGTVVGQEPWSFGLIKAAGPQSQVKGGGDIFRPVMVAASGMAFAFGASPRSWATRESEGDVECPAAWQTATSYSASVISRQGTVNL